VFEKTQNIAAIIFFNQHRHIVSLSPHTATRSDCGIFFVCFEQKARTNMQ